MRLVHWVQVPGNPNVRSGMLSSISELVEAEMKILGVRNVALSDPAEEKGGKLYPLRNRTVAIRPWQDVLDDPDAVHLVHTYSPKTMYDMRRKVFVAHGIPEYCWWDDLLGITPNWWQLSTMIRLCDATITWFKRDIEFWEGYGEGKIHSIRRGLDLKHWTLEGEKAEYFMKPQLLYGDALRLVKLPFTPLFALKKIQKRLKHVHFRLIFTDPKQELKWSNLITSLQIEHLCPLILGVVMDPRPIWRGVDIGISPILWGLTSRVPLELMACGTPVICFKGLDDSPIYGLRVEDSPEAVAAGVFRLWDRIQADPEGEAIRARRVAEKHWDIRETAKAIIKVCEKVM